MGCLQSLIASVLGGGDGGSSKNDTDVELAIQPVPILLSVRTANPTLKITKGTTCSGVGTVIADAAIEQDSAYWEAKIVSTGTYCLGVARKMNRKDLGDATFPDNETTWGFCSQKTTEDDEHTNSDDADETKEKKDDNWGFAEVDVEAKAAFEDGDVIGIALDFTYFPMLTFYKNGELLEDFSVQRIRGTVFPAVRIAEEGAEIDMVFGPTNKWKYPPPRQCTQITKSQSML